MIQLSKREVCPWKNVRKFTILEKPSPITQSFRSKRLKDFQYWRKIIMKCVYENDDGFSVSKPRLCVCALFIFRLAIVFIGLYDILTRASIQLVRILGVTICDDYYYFMKIIVNIFWMNRTKYYGSYVIDIPCFFRCDYHFYCIYYFYRFYSKSH